MTPFPPRLFCKAGSKMAGEPFLFVISMYVYIIKRKLHGGLKIRNLSSRVENNILVVRCAHS
jgi:hypothetical protein